MNRKIDQTEDLAILKLSNELPDCDEDVPCSARSYGMVAVASFDGSLSTPLKSTLFTT